MTDDNNLILHRIDEFIRKYYKNSVIRGSLWTVAVLLGLFILYSILESLGWFPTVIRAILFWSYIIVAILLISLLIIRPLLKMYKLGRRITYQQAATIIGDHFPEIKDKLLNLLQLQELASVNHSNISNDHSDDNELLLAGIRQKTVQLSPIPFKNAINFNGNKKYIKFVVIPLLLIILILIIAPHLLTDSTKRIADYSSIYERPAPFSFIVENTSLQVIQHEDFVLNIAIDGDSYPADVYVVFDGHSYKMQSSDRSHFTYTFRQLQHSLTFNLTAAGYSSNDYQLSVLPKPAVIDFHVSLTYPSYTRQQPLTISNKGDLNVSQGTSIRWSLLTKDVDSLFFVVDNVCRPLSPDPNGRISIDYRATHSTDYYFLPLNSHTISSDTLRYSISVIPDVAPMIAVVEMIDTSLPDRHFFRGHIKDDYGFSKLEFIIERNNITDTSRHHIFNYPLSVSNDISQEFIHSFNFNQIDIITGDNLQYYFVVYDNDAINGPKSASSQQFSIEIPTEKELTQLIQQNNNEAYNNANQSIAELKKVQQEINELMRRLVDKKELTWQEQQQLQELAQRQKQVHDQLQQMQQQLHENANLEDKYRQPNDQILQKQEELDRLLNEVLNDEMRDIMKQIDSLLSQTDKTSVQEQLEQLKIDNEQLEHQIDQDIDLLRRLEMEKKVDNAIKQLDDLSNRQKQLSDEADQLGKSNISKDERQQQQESLQQRQEQLNQEFNEQMDEIEKIRQDYKDIDKSLDFNVDKDLQDQIHQDQKEAADNLKKKDNKKASKNQRDAANEMEQLSEQLASEQMRLEQEDLAEDSEQMRRILKSLVQLSFDQESLITNTKKTYIQDPVYQDLIAQQNKIKDDFRNVEDTLSAIARRQVAVATAISKEVGDVNSNIQRSLSTLLHFNQSFYGNSINYSAAQPMQYSMTAINNLSLLLAESFDAMQNEMRQNASMKMQGSCKRNTKSKQQGNSHNQSSQKPSAKSIKQMQEQLNKQLESLKQQMNQDGKNQKRGSGRHTIGQGNQMSEEFSKMAAQQEAIRRMMQQYGQELKQQSAGNAQLSKEIDELLRQMEQTETDLVNRTITNQTIKRQEQILTRLLEHERAEMQREQEEKRQSHEASDQYQPSPADIQQFEQLKKSNQELFRTTPPSLTPYYKRKVSEYFYKL